MYSAMLSGITASLLISSVQAAACYSVNGTELIDGTYLPCHADAEASACCAINKEPPDICMSSGLCYSQYMGWKGFIYMNGCTDNTGQAAECPHICPDGM